MVQELADDSTDIFSPSWIDTHYPNRPDLPILNKMHLFDFVRYHDIISNKPLFKNTIYYPYKNKFLRVRQPPYLQPYLINHYNHDVNQHPENYYYTLLLFFKPWRDIKELKGDFNTYTEAFRNVQDSLEEAMIYHEKLEEIRLAREHLNKEVQNLLSRNLDVLTGSIAMSADKLLPLALSPLTSHKYVFKSFQLYSLGLTVRKNVAGP